MGLLEPQGSYNEYHPQASATSFPLHLNREEPQPQSLTSFFLEQKEGSRIHFPQRLANIFVYFSSSRVCWDTVRMYTCSCGDEGMMLGTFLHHSPLH